MRLYSPVDLAGNVNMIEKLILSGTGILIIAISLTGYYWFMICYTTLDMR